MGGVVANLVRMYGIVRYLTLVRYLLNTIPRYLSWKINLKVLGYAYLSVCTTIGKFLHRWRDICEALKRACYSLAAPELPSCQQHGELLRRQCRTPVARAPPTLNLSFVPSALALARSEGMVVQLGQRRETWLINFS